MRNTRALLDAVAVLAKIARDALDERLSSPPGPSIDSDNVGQLVDKATGQREDAPTMSQVKVLGMSADEFRLLRRESELTQSEAAQRLGVSHRTVTRWEAGKARIDVWKAREVRKILRPGLKGFEARMKRRNDNLATRYANLTSGENRQAVYPVAPEIEQAQVDEPVSRPSRSGYFR